MTRLLLLAAITWAAGSGCQPTSPSPQSTKSPDPDRQYMQQIADRDQDMVAIASSAEQRASEEHFRTMAHNCIAKQQTESRQLQDLLGRWYGVQYTPQPTADSQKILAHLNSLSGRDFDHEYLTDMIHEYQSNVETSRSEADRASRSELRSFARQVVKEQSHQASHLQEHLAELDHPDAAHDEHAGGHEHAHDER